MNNIANLYFFPEYHHKWVVKGSKIEVAPPSPIPLFNLIDFVNVLKFTQSTLANPTNATFNKVKVDLIYLSLDYITQRLQQALDKKGL